MLSAQKTAGTIILILVGIVTLFHFLVLAGILPYQIVWGGRLKSPSEMYLLESISLVLNALIFCFVGVHIQWLKWSWSRRITTIFMRVFAVLFALNTVGNLMAETILEKVVFTPITLMLCLLFLRLSFNKAT